MFFDKQRTSSDVYEEKILKEYDNEEEVQKYAQMPKNELKQLCEKMFKGAGEDLTWHEKLIVKTVYNKRFSLKHEVFEGSSIPLHHKLYTWTGEIRRTQERVAEIDEQFSRLKPLTRDCVFYRGAGSGYEKEILENAKPGDLIVPDKGFSYTAFSPNLAEEFSKGIIYEIHVGEGAKVSRNNEHGGEAIMPCGAKYRLIAKEPYEFSGERKKYMPETLKVVMEYILPDESV